jgi:hypothetical protein
MSNESHNQHISKELAQAETPEGSDTNVGTSHISPAEDELEQSITKMIAKYLKGIHHPDEDPLENDLRAMKNTQDLKAAILAWHQRKLEAEVAKVIGEDNPIPPHDKGFFGYDQLKGANALRAEQRKRLAQLKGEQPQ